MIKTLAVRNPNDALLEGLWHLKTAGTTENSRNGRVLVAPGPVVTATALPKERVLFDPVRDCNPFFHLLESLWMLAGRNDTASLVQYVARMQDFSDDGTTLNGAYGFRWREYFGYDQIDHIIQELRMTPTSRRCVLAMWDGGHQVPDGATYAIDSDLIKATSGSKDVPCNTHIYFRIIDKRLDMTVCCRSNDAVWGCHGANAVHFSVLQEYMALALGVGVGTMYQFSNNYHLYIDRPDTAKLYAPAPEADRQYDQILYQPEDWYKTGATEVVPLLQYKEDIDALTLDICEYFDGHPHDRSYFMAHVFSPMMALHAKYKAGDFADSYAVGDWAREHMIAGCDWHYAATAWVHRRLQAKAVKDAAG